MLLTYGKRLFAERIGAPVGLERAPALAPTAFGLSKVRRLIEDLQRTESECGIVGVPAAKG